MRDQSRGEMRIRPRKSRRLTTTTNEMTAIVTDAGSGTPKRYVIVPLPEPNPSSWELGVG